jgi:hypothetical protein
VFHILITLGPITTFVGVLGSNLIGLKFLKRCARQCWLICVQASVYDLHDYMDEKREVSARV